MFNSFEPNVKATIAFLKLLNVKVSNATVNETLQNHPDWPSLLCISDSLNKWNIPNGAGRIDVNNIEQLPIPFMAYTNDREVPLAIVKQIFNSKIQIHQKNYNKPTTEDKEDFLKKWDGVYLVAEPTKHSGETNFELNRRKSFFTTLIPISLFAALIILSLLFLNKIAGITDFSQSFNTIAIYLQYVILMSGVFVTSLLLWYEMDKNNPVLQKVCTGIAKGNCNAILTGKQAKVFNWLSWSEVGFFYFTGGILVLLSALAQNNVTNSIALLGWLNILALPYTVFSIYYQWSVAKQWCVLCLAVQALLILGGINVITNSFLFPFPNLSLPFLLRVVLLCLMPVLFWYAIKPYLLLLQEAKNTKHEYLRIKFNAEIFETLLKKQKVISTSPDGIGIDLGNPSAKNSLIKVCNPYCGPCSKAHPKIEKLLEENVNLKAKIIFNTPNNKDNPLVKPVKHLLAIAENNNNETITKKALDDWYMAETKDYELFAAKYPMNGELLKQDDKIEAMDKWCNAMKISFTPTIFINGYQLPNAYRIEDLQYFLLE